jgi:hypothetical protein
MLLIALPSWINRSNNRDRDKVLSTVAFTALDFTNQFPYVQIFAEGSTSARTRLYQKGIANNLLEINRYFKIEGFVNGEWEFFLRGRNYEAFLIPNMPDYSKDPFFVKKVDRARAFIAKNGLPKDKNRKAQKGK